MAEQTDIVEQVKAKNPIEDVIEADGFPLPKRGRYRKCTTKGTGGLVVDVQNQAYHWNAKAEHGDVIKWVEERKGVDFKGAVEILCARAGLPTPNWGNQDPATRLAARIREEALDVAQRVFARWLAKSEEAQAYVARRGWGELWEAVPGAAAGAPSAEAGTGKTKGKGHAAAGPSAEGVLSAVAGVDGAAAAVAEDEERKPGTAMVARLGYSGEGSEAERIEMRKALDAAGVDLDSPVAVAILGYKGDVVSWGKRHDVQPDDKWTLEGYIPGMLGRKRLVYPHIQGGRVVYLTGRSIEGKYHYNLPVALVGKRLPFFNQVYARNDQAVVVVEGQADAVSLGQWGIMAVALAGVAPDDELAEALKKHGAIYVGLDQDQAGQANAWTVANALGPLTRLVAWRCEQHPSWRDGDEAKGIKDANDLLRAMRQAGETDEAQKAFVHGLLDDAATYAEQICLWAGMQEGAARDEALPKALAVVAKMDGFKFSQYRDALAKLLKVGIRQLENMLKTLKAETEKAQSVGEPVYTWGGAVQGWLLEYLYDQETDRPSLAWRDPQGRIDAGECVTIGERTYRPYPSNDAIRSGALSFPSRLGESRSIRELVGYIEQYLNSIYLMPSDKLSRLVAYWVLTTWIYDAFETVIYLRAMGGAGSGKSELIKRIGMVCYRTMVANGAGSTSSLFRSVERYKGTVILDEADLQQSDTEANMVKFYNLGAMRNNPIWRTVEVTGPNGEKDWEAVSFQTFCPKLIAMRKEFRDDAVGTRSLTLKLAPREMTELKAAGIPLTVNNTIRTRAQAMRNLLVRWRLATWQPEIEVDMELYEMTISARLNQVAGPLLAIAMDDPEQQEDIRRTLREYYAETIITQSMTLNARVIEAMWKIWRMPGYHKAMVKVEADGTELIKIGDITRITNEIINDMNDEEEEEEEEGAKKFSKAREVKSQRVGRIIRNELQMQVTTRRRDGFWVYWNEPKMVGLSTKFGINPDDFAPAQGTNGTPVPAPQATQESLV